MATFDIKDLTGRMNSSLDVLKRELQGLRTGRASANLLEGVHADAYGSMTPLSSLGSVSTPEARLLTVTVWDHGLVKAVEKAIRDGGLGLNPQTEGNVIRIPVPALTEERRGELVKVAGKYAESAKIAVRNVRRDGMETLKKSDAPEDEQKRKGEEVQKLTDKFVKDIDDLLSAKEKEIKQI